jgi:M6 family metalloprotease-like protein
MKKLFIFFAIVFAFVSKAQPDEIKQLKSLSERGKERAKIVMEKMNELFREQPELKKYVSQPATRNILQEIRAKKAGKGEVDTVRVLGIRVEFQEHPKDSLATGTGRIRTWRDSTIVEVTSEGDTIKVPVPPFEVSMDTTIINSDTIIDTTAFHNLYYDPPHTKRYFEHQLEALRNYWLDNSCGKLYIDFTVAPVAENTAYPLPYQVYYYGDPSNYVDGLLTLLRDALLACDQDPSKPFRMGDYDAYFVFHAGCSYQAQAGWGNTPYDIFSAYIRGLDGYFGTPVWVDNGTYPITDGTIMPESDFKYGVPAFMQGGIVHEFGHQLGLFDLYDTSGWTIGCGGWALMGTGNWNMNGLLPPHVSAWHAERLGWVKLDEIDKNSDSVDVYYMGGNDCTKTKIYKIPINSDEYFLITNRQVWANPDTNSYVEIRSADSTLHYDSSAVRVWKDGVLTRFDDYDYGLPPDPTDTLHPTYGGLAIWHIDKNKIAKDSLWNAINAGSPKGVDMEEADGIQDFDMSIVSDYNAAFFGSPWDVFFDGSATSFTPYTLPNTDDNNEVGSHIYIQEISESDTIMTFSIRFDLQYSDFPINPGHIFDVNSPAVVEVEGEKLIVCSVMDTINGGSVFVCTSDGTILWQNTVRDTVGNTIFGAAIYSSPAIGDIDGNDTLDVVCGAYFARWRERPPSRFYSTTDSVLEAWGRVYAWNIYGETIKGFSVRVNDAIIASPLLADIDGDDAKEIIIGSHDTHLEGRWHTHGFNRFKSVDLDNSST